MNQIPPKATGTWVMKRMETTNDGKISVTDENSVVDFREIPNKPAPEQQPLAKDCTVTEKFRDGGPNHPWSIFVNYRCGICDQFFRVALDNVFGPGDRVIQCECRASIRLNLIFD
jgi:hypothetical protein